MVVTGLSSPQVVKSFGEPVARVPTGQGERWTYRAGGCQLDVFMFPDVSHGGLTALDDRVSDSEAKPGGEQGCLRRLRDGHAIEAAPLAGRTARVALVDDDGVFLRLLADNLRAAGLDPVCYTDPHLALAALRRPPSPDACILDWNMPGINGLDLLTELRRAGFRQPVLFLTSHSQPMFEEAALTAGAVDFVDKARGPAITCGVSRWRWSALSPRCRRRRRTICASANCCCAAAPSARFGAVMTLRSAAANMR